MWLWLQLVSVGLIGSVFWVVNTESMAMYAGTQGMHPILVGVYCSLGQNAAYVVLYFGGDWLIRRWSWLGAKVELVRARVKNSSRQRFTLITIVAALTGIPPIVGMVAAAPAFHIPLRRVLAITLPCRTIRFSVLAAFGPLIWAQLQQFLQWIGLA